MKAFHGLTCRLFATLLAGLLFHHAATTANAGFVAQGWSGFFDSFVDTTATFQPGPAGDGTVNFAVYNNTDGDWTNDFGAAFQNAIASLLSPVQSAAKFVYFFQLVNNNIADIDGTKVGSAFRSFADSSLNELVIPTAATSAGRISGFVFNDASGAVGLAANTYLGANPAGGPGPVPNTLVGLTTAKTVLSDVAENGLPTNSTGGLAATPFVANASAINATTATQVSVGWVSDPLSLDPISSGIAFHFDPNLVTVGKFSSLVFFTSDQPYQYLTSRIDGVTGQAFNELPSVVAAAAPEPSSFVLLLAGLGSLGAFNRRRFMPVAAK